MRLAGRSLKKGKTTRVEVAVGAPCRAGAAFALQELYDVFSVDAVYGR